MKLKSVSRKTYFESKICCSDIFDGTYHGDYHHINVLYVFKAQVNISIGIKKYYRKRNNK